MINLLLIEDDPVKLAAIQKTLIDIDPALESGMVVVDNVIEAKRSMTRSHFDIVILDLVIPMRKGEEPKPQHSCDLISDVEVNQNLKAPLFVIGLTKYTELTEQYVPFFEQRLYYLLNYAQNSDEWKYRLKAIVFHCLKFQKSILDSDDIRYQYDAAIICAIYNPEFAEVKGLTKDWKKIEVPGDPTLYYEAILTKGDQSRKIIAAVNDQMGMVATSALSTKMMMKFRPRYIFLTGISAGIRKKGVNYGDILIPDICWDYNSGKISEFKAKTDDSDQQFTKMIFEPDPRSLALHASLRAKLVELSNDADFLKSIHKAWTGQSAKTELKAIVGPLASGSEVVASSARLSKIKEQNRKLIGIEMEAYGLFYACHQYSNQKILPIVIKSVCDFGTKSKNDKHQKYAAFTSTRFAIEFLFRYL